jgi:hypothetical protein
VDPLGSEAIKESFTATVWRRIVRVAEILATAAAAKAGVTGSVNHHRRPPLLQNIAFHFSKRRQRLRWAWNPKMIPSIPILAGRTS